jgi:uncharacterized lipoprotein YmbA
MERSKKSMKFGMACKIKRGPVFSWAVVVSALLLNGCARDSEPVQFYRLNADAAVSPQPLAPANEAVIGLGPIRIPDYLNRPQMVVAITANQYRLAENHRWAERLDQNISLALFKALPAQLGTDRIVRYPWPQRQTVDYQAGIDILEFNVNASGQSRLIAQWFVKRGDKIAVNKRSSYQFPGSSTDHEAMVKAQSQCLTELGREIAETLRGLMAQSAREK